MFAGTFWGRDVYLLENCLDTSIDNEYYATTKHPRRSHAYFNYILDKILYDFLKSEGNICRYPHEAWGDDKTAHKTKSLSFFSFISERAFGFNNILLLVFQRVRVNYLIKWPFTLNIKKINDVWKLKSGKKRYSTREWRKGCL